MCVKKLIVVAGATGSQGSSVAGFLLNDGTFNVRCLTRNPDSPAAQDLIAKGAEVVKADRNDRKSLEQTFQGAYGVFGVTNYWESGVGAKGEISQGKAMVDAAKAAGVEHFVWSTLDSSVFKAKHWESKAAVDDYLRKSGVPRTSLYTTFYFENFSGSMRPEKRSNGTYDFALPLITDAPFAMFSVADTGAYALAAFLQPEAWLNKDMRIASEFLSIREISNTISEASGKYIHVQDIDEKTFKELKGNGIPEELHANMMVLFAYPTTFFRDTALTRKIYPDTKTFQAWVEENLEKILPK
ncbi:NmrA-domain-containing protein [Ramaria rubella]|nr:NmrA-domain-containing protein [Ramaria rubella]